MLKHYPGAKNGSGVAEKIISLMPPHTTYIEGFLGSGVILRKKLPAKANMAFEKNAHVCAFWKQYYAPHLPPADIACGDFIKWLSCRPPVLDALETLIYLDPPYLGSVRTRRFYEHELSTEEEHAELLRLLLPLPCMVMLSGYYSPLYAAWLDAKVWRRVDIPTMTRGGPRTECVWCNFPHPDVLHDARFAGGGYRERYRIKRKTQRWAARFAAMPAAERQIIATALASVDRATSTAALRVDADPDTVAGVAGSRTPFPAAT